MVYTIGKRERTTFLDDRGMATDGYRIWYTMEDGTVDYVEVSKANFTPDNVRNAIEQEISKHGQLMGF